MRLALALVGMMIAAGPGAAQEWSRFRGPNGDGVSRAVLPTRWSDRGYAWQVKLPGPGHSSPVLWGDRLFVTATGEPGKLHVLCFDAKSGRQHWNRAFVAGPSRGHKDNSLASATPAVDAEHVYVTWGTPKEIVLLALTHEGAEVWRRDLGPYRAGHGFGASPVVHAGLVLQPCEENGKDCLVAVEARTGKDRWRVPRKSRNTYATPCIYQPAGQAAQVIAVSYEDGVTSLDPASGKLNWAADVFDKRHVEGAIASPFVQGDLLFATAGWLSVRYETIALRADGKGKVETVFKLDRDAPLVPTPIARDDLVFLWSDRGIVSCSSTKTGANHWRERVEGTFYASPVIAGEHVYCPSREGEMFVLAARSKFELVARIPLGEGTHATPALADGRLFVRTATRLLCLDSKTQRD